MKRHTAKLVLAAAFGMLGIVASTQATDIDKPIAAGAQAVPEAKVLQDATAFEAKVVLSGGTSVGKAQVLKTALIDQSGVQTMVYYGKHYNVGLTDKQLAATTVSGGWATSPTETAPTSLATAQVSQTDEAARFNL
jgi:hypothetical protein